MSIEKAEIINWALTEIGVGPVFVTGSTDDLSRQVDNTWQRTVDYAFSLEPWNWATRTRKLVRQAGEPINGYQYGFDLPADRIGHAEGFFRTFGPNPVPIRYYTIEGSTVFCNEDTAYATYRVIIDPADWDITFRAAFVKLLASELAIPVYGDSSLKEQLRAEALGSPSKEGTGGMFGRLMAQNKAAQPLGQAPTDDVLTSARYASAGPTPWYGRF